MRSDHGGECRVVEDDGDPCGATAVAGLGICGRHIRRRAGAIRLSGGLDLDADVPGEDA